MVFNRDLGKRRISVNSIEDSECNCQYLNTTCQSLQSGSNFTTICRETVQKYYVYFPLACTCDNFRETCQFLDELNQTAANKFVQPLTVTSTGSLATWSASSITLSSSLGTVSQEVLQPTTSRIQISTTIFSSESSTSMIPQPSVQPLSSPEKIQMVQSSFQAMINSKESSSPCSVPPSVMKNGPQSVQNSPSNPFVQIISSILPSQSPNANHTHIATSSILMNLEIANLESNMTDSSRISGAVKSLTPGFIMGIFPIVFMMAKLINI